MMTRDDLEARKKKLEAEVQEILLQYRGAMAEVEFWLRKAEKKDAAEAERKEA